MTNNQEERLVLALSQIASALKGLHEEAKRAGDRYWPSAREQKETIWSRVENDEDRARKNLGLTDESISIDKWLEPDWLDDENNSGVVGERSAQWLRDHPPAEAPKETKKPDAGPEAPVRDKKGAKGTSKAKDQA